MREQGYCMYYWSVEVGGGGGCEGPTYVLLVSVGVGVRDQHMYYW